MNKVADYEVSSKGWRIDVQLTFQHRILCAVCPDCVDQLLQETGDVALREPEWLELRPGTACAWCAEADIRTIVRDEDARLAQIVWSCGLAEGGDEV